jgi:hypothetical protein
MALTKYNGNIPLICKVEYAPVSDISQFLRVGTSEVDILLVEEKVWNEIYITPASAQFKDKMDKAAAGSLFTNELTFSFPGNDKTAMAEFLMMDGCKLIVRITYSDNQIVIMGNPDEPAFIFSDFESGNKTIFNCSFRCTSIERIRFEIL